MLKVGQSMYSALRRKNARSRLTGQAANEGVDIIVRSSIGCSIRLKDVSIPSRGGKKFANGLVSLAHQEFVQLLGEESWVDQGVVPWTTRVQGNSSTCTGVNNGSAERRREELTRNGGDQVADNSNVVTGRRAVLNDADKAILHDIDVMRFRFPRI